MKGADRAADECLRAMSELKASEYGWVAALDDGHGRLDAVPFKTPEEALELAWSGDHVSMPLVALDQGVPCSMQFRAFLRAEDMEPPFEESSAEYNNNPFIDYEDDWVYLDDSWEWANIEADVWKRLGHRTTGIKHHNVGELVVKAVYDLEDSLRHIHPRVNAESVANFIGSWNVWFHLCQFREQLKSSPTVKRIVAKPDEPNEALTAVNYCLWSYVHHLRTEASSSNTETTSSECLKTPKQRVVDYKKKFLRYKITNANIYNAVGLNKAEFSRWFNHPNPKEDSSANQLMKRILEQDKAPWDFAPHHVQHPDSSSWRDKK